MTPESHVRSTALLSTGMTAGPGIATSTKRCKGQDGLGTHGRHHASASHARARDVGSFPSAS